jgi:tetratricopeptide (TPR) repeat protein
MDQAEPPSAADKAPAAQVATPGERHAEPHVLPGDHVAAGNGPRLGNDVRIHVDGTLGIPPQVAAPPRASAFQVLGGIDRGLVWFFKRVSLFILGAVLIAIVLAVYRMSLERKFRFSDIEVPADFAAAGYTGSYVARGIMDQMHRIRDAAGTLASMRQVRRKGERDLPPLNIQVQGQSIPLDALVNALWPAWSDSTLFVGGELAHTGSKARLTVRVGTTSKTFPFTTRTPELPPQILQDAAEFILQAAEPYVLASYFAGGDSLARMRAESLMTVLTRSKDRRLRAQAFTGLVDLRQGDLTFPAETLLILSRTADPTYPGAYVDLATVYNWRHRNTQALEILDSAPKGEPGWDAVAASNRSGILNDLGRYSEGLRDADRAMAMEDGFAPRVNAAKALVGLKRLEEAEVQYEHALTFAPGGHPIRFNQAIVLALRGHKAAARELGRKVRLADASLALPTQMLDALSSSVDSVLGVGTSLDARSRALALSNLGEWLSVFGRHAEAKRLLDASLALQTSTPIVLWRAARAACWRGDSAEARTRFERFRFLDDSLNGVPMVRVEETACTPPETLKLHTGSTGGTWHSPGSP